MYVVCIFDRKTSAYHRPFFVRAIGEAMRVFRDEVNRPADDNVLYRHPEDFDLFHIGSWDDLSGRLRPVDPTMIDTGAKGGE